MIFAGMAAIVIKGLSKAGGFQNAMDIAGEGGRLEILKLDCIFSKKINTY